MVCNNSTCQGCSNAADCLCPSGFSAQADFFPILPCSVSIVATKSLWGLAAAFWISLIFYCFYASMRLERRAREAFIHELVLLTLILITSLCHLSVSLLEASVSQVGQRSIGIDPTVTALYAVANTLFWGFLTINPFSKAQTGVSSLALTRVSIKKSKNAFLTVMPVIFLVASAIQYLPFLIVYHGSSYSLPISSIFFGLLGVSVASTSIMHFLLLYLLYRDFSKALSSSVRELPPSHRMTIERVILSTRKVIVVPLFTLSVLSPVCFVFAFPEVSPNAWVLIPVISISQFIWFFRYVNRSIKASRLVGKDPEKSSHHQRQTAEVKTK